MPSLQVHGSGVGEGDAVGLAVGNLVDASVEKYYPVHDAWYMEVGGIATSSSTDSRGVSSNCLNGTIWQSAIDNINLIRSRRNSD